MCGRLSGRDQPLNELVHVRAVAKRALLAISIQNLHNHVPNISQADISGR